MTILSGFAYFIYLDQTATKNQTSYLDRLRNTHQYIISEFENNQCQNFNFQEQVQPTIIVYKAGGNTKHQTTRKKTVYDQINWQEVYQYMNKDSIAIKAGEIFKACISKNKRPSILAKSHQNTNKKKRSYSNRPDEELHGGSGVVGTIGGYLAEDLEVIRALQEAEKTVTQVKTIRGYISEFVGNIDNAKVIDTPPISVYPKHSLGTQTVSVKYKDGHDFEAEKVVMRPKDRLTHFHVYQDYVWYFTTSLGSASLSDLSKSSKYKPCQNCINKDELIPVGNYQATVIRAHSYPWTVSRSQSTGLYNYNGLFPTNIFLSVTGDSSFLGSHVLVGQPEVSSPNEEKLKLSDIELPKTSARAGSPLTRAAMRFKEYLIENEGNDNPYVWVSKVTVSLTMTIDQWFSDSLIVADFSFDGAGNIKSDFDLDKQRPHNTLKIIYSGVE